MKEAERAILIDAVVLINQHVPNGFIKDEWNRRASKVLYPYLTEDENERLQRIHRALGKKS